MSDSNSGSNCSNHPHPSEFPIGLGTMDIHPDEISAAITSALRLGYRRIDCAPVYFNEDKIGDALSEVLGKPFPGEAGEEEGGDPNENKTDVKLLRKDLFVVSKLASPFHRKEHVKIGLRKTLNDLRLGYLDLYLVHWPQAFHFVDIDPDIRGYDGEAQYIDDSNDGANIDPSVSIHETWTAMEELVEEGLVKNIGVSNFPVSLLHELMAGNHKIPPAVNQVEMHPYLQQSRLLAYCQKRKVHVQAYSPLGTSGYKEENEPTVLEDPVLQRIAANHRITVAQLCVVWAHQRGTTVVVKSASAERQKENWESIAGGHVITLSERELSEIEGLERGHRFFRPEQWWGNMAMAVFD
jgi:alcohol dehydrogenase (NADP+)